MIRMPIRLMAITLTAVFIESFRASLLQNVLT